MYFKLFYSLYNGFIETYSLPVGQKVSVASPPAKAQDYVPLQALPLTQSECRNSPNTWPQSAVAVQPAITCPSYIPAATVVLVGDTILMLLGRVS